MVRCGKPYEKHSLFWARFPRGFSSFQFFFVATLLYYFAQRCIFDGKTTVSCVLPDFNNLLQDNSNNRSRRDTETSHATMNEAPTVTFTAVLLSDGQPVSGADNISLNVIKSTPVFLPLKPTNQVHKMYHV